MHLMAKCKLVPHQFIRRPPGELVRNEFAFYVFRGDAMFCPSAKPERQNRVSESWSFRLTLSLWRLFSLEKSQIRTKNCATFRISPAFT